MNIASASEVKSGPGSMPKSAHLLCGWPLAMVLFGGAIGGGLGGAAYGVNVLIYKSRLPLAAKIVLNLFTGLSALGLWVLVATAIQLMRR
jgi:hypothetical protein